MAFDPTKPVTTRDGRPARIICTDMKHKDGGDSIVALVPPLFHRDGLVEQALCYQSDGAFERGRESVADLINVSVKKWKWIYKTPSGDTAVSVSHYTSGEEMARSWPNFVSEVIGRLLESEKVDHAS